jgi:hypothetical protein
MSDYLSNLAARSLEAVPTIRPRLASFYEAPQRGFALPPEPSEETGEVTNDIVAMPAQMQLTPLSPATTSSPARSRSPSATKRARHPLPLRLRLDALLIASRNRRRSHPRRRRGSRMPS